LGCGDGRLLKLLPPGVDYLGVDSSAELIGLAQKQYPSGHFLLKDILNLDFKQEFPGGAGPTESWDAVLAFAVISHLPTVELRQQALTKIFEALRPGGVVILTCWNFWRLTRREKSIWRYKIFERNRNREWGMGNEEWGMRNGDSGLRFKDIMTYFQDGDKKYPLYYYAYTLGELRRQVRKSGFKIVETYYEKDGQKTSWGRGYNLVVVGRKMV
jgi:SAM-dependent methyltransferase